MISDPHNPDEIIQRVPRSTPRECGEINEEGGHPYTLIPVPDVAGISKTLVLGQSVRVMAETLKHAGSVPLVLDATLTSLNARTWALDLSFLTAAH